MRRKTLFSQKTVRLLISLMHKAIVFSMLISQGSMVYFFASLDVRTAASVSVVVFGAHVTYTSLLFNRARAYDDGPVKRRTLVAAEFALRSTLIFLGISALQAVAFQALLGLGYKPVPLDWDNFQYPEKVPSLIAFLIVSGILVNAFLLSTSLSILLRRDFGVIMGKNLLPRKRKTN